MTTLIVGFVIGLIVGYVIGFRRGQYDERIALVTASLKHRTTLGK